MTQFSSNQLIASGSITATQAVRYGSVSGQVVGATTNLNSDLFNGIAFATVSNGNIVYVQTNGTIDPAFFNLGDGYVCAVGVNSSGIPVRVTDVTCVSGLNYLGSCDGYGTITVAPRKSDNINVKDFGAVGDGITDDSGAIQNSLSKAATINASVFLPAATYLINSELSITSSPTRVIGVSNAILTTSGTILKAGTLGQRSILTIKSSDYINIYGITFDADAKAYYAMYLQGCALSSFEKCFFNHAVWDGIYLSQINDSSGATVNDTNSYTDCNLLYNGTIFASTGLFSTYSGAYGSTSTNLGSVTASCTIGSQIISFVGTTLTTLGLRAGDWLRLDVASPQYLQVYTIDSDTQITVGIGRLPTVNKTNVDFVIAKGNGYTEYQHSDNNLANWKGGLLRGNAGVALAFCGLYGPTVNLPQIDTNGFYGISIGRFDDVSAVYDSQINAYYESNLAANIAFGGAQGVSSSGLGSDNYHIGSSSVNWGTTPPAQGNPAAQPIGGARSNIPVLQSSIIGFTLNGPYIDNATNVSIISDTATISSATTYGQLHLDTNHTLTSTPSIAAGTDGQELVLLRDTSNYTLTLQDSRLLVGSGVTLATPTIVLGPSDTIRLKYYAGYSTWREISRSSAAPGTFTAMTAGGSVTAGKAVVLIDGYVQPFSSSSLQAAGNIFGIALFSTAAGGKTSVKINGSDAFLPSLGDGYICAVGCAYDGTLCRVTDPTFASGLNYLGYCDGYGTITVAPRRAENYNVKDFGAVGDGVTNDKTAIDAAISAASVAGGTVLFEAKNYFYDTSDLTISAPIVLQGATDLGTSKITMGAGLGIITTQSASGLIAEKLAIYSSDNWPSTWSVLQPGSGKTLWHTQCLLRLNNIKLQGGLGHGFEIDGYTAIADSGTIIDLFVYGCAGHGIYAHGGDANQWNIINPLVQACGGWGSYDYSFLGNVWIGGQYSSNRLGAYRNDGLDSSSTYISCYSENDQAPNFFLTPALVLSSTKFGGGTHGRGAYSTLPNRSTGGVYWTSGHTYQMGDLVESSSHPGYTFRCAKNNINWPNAGASVTSGLSEPSWNLGAGDITVDNGGIFWETYVQTPDNGAAQIDDFYASPKHIIWGGSSATAATAYNKYISLVGDEAQAAYFLTWLAASDNPNLTAFDYTGLYFAYGEALYGVYPGRYFSNYGRTATQSTFIGLTFQGGVVTPGGLRCPPEGAIGFPNGLYAGGTTTGVDERRITFQAVPPTRGQQGDRFFNSGVYSGDGYTTIDYWIIKASGASDAATFASSTNYHLGDLVKPSTPDTYVYECIIGGLSSTEPVWTGGSVTTGTATFRRFGTDFTSAPGNLYSSAIAP